MSQDKQAAAKKALEKTLKKKREVDGEEIYYSTLPIPEIDAIRLRELVITE